MKIIIVEDDPETAESVANALAQKHRKIAAAAYVS
jgi:DNA-binding response OmpR family regulator